MLVFFFALFAKYRLSEQLSEKLSLKLFFGLICLINKIYDALSHLTCSVNYLQCFKFTLMFQI